MLFDDFFVRIHARAPFPWQRRLSALVADGRWPEAVHLPTSAGKTAIIDVWLWARSQGWAHVPRRLYYLIDRRSLVDAAADYAQASMSRSGTDGAVVRLRGGMAAADDEWLLNPARSTLVSTTVDQLGSRLLGRAYGVGRYSAAIHAGLAGNDALIVVDEAHLVEPLRQTLDRIAVLRQRAQSPLPLPWQVVTMTATPTTGGAVLQLDEADLSNPLLAARLGAHKFASLHATDEWAQVAFVAQAHALRAAGASVVGIVVNRVALAREIHDLLAEQDDAMLLIGRSRPFEREALGAELLRRCGTQSRATDRDPLYVVATQTIEVGLDLDFDALVTELAPVSALRQRFGRLDRLGALGTSRAAIVSTQGSALPYRSDELDAARKWLSRGATTVKGLGKVVDMGVHAVAQREAAPAEGVAHAPVLLAQDLPLLFDPGLTIDVEPYLHGERRRGDVTIAWRASLDELEPLDWPNEVERRLPLTPELMPLPVRAARAWLAGTPVDASDLETEPEAEAEAPGKPAPRAARTPVAPFVLWDGEAAWLSTDPSEVQQGVCVVLPASRGGYDPFGWSPASASPVRDLMAEGVVHGNAWRGLNTRTTHEIPLASHLKGVGDKAAEFARACGLDAELVDALAQAGRLHDLGKNDARFQLLLGARHGELLAKSGVIDPRITRELAGLPVGWRHEVASLAARPDASPLVRYLVGTHHGRGKPWLPAGPDVVLWRSAQGDDWPRLHREIVERHGWWGAAMLEALLRLADWARSVDEQLAGEVNAVEAA